MGAMPLRVGIIGCGGITAFAHLPALCRMANDVVEIAYLCDTEIERAKVLGRRFNLQHATYLKDYREVLTDDTVKAVILASWPTNHASMAIESIKSGKNVLIQKPLLLPESAASEFLAICKQTDVNVLALPLVDTISPFVKLREILNTGALGSVRFARVRTTIPGPNDYYDDVREFFREPATYESPFLKSSYAQGAGSVADMGPYALTAFYYLFGPGKLRFSSRTPSDFDMSTLLVLEIPWHEKFQIPSTEIPICSVEIGWQQVRGSDICTIVGSAGTATIDSIGRLVVFSRDGMETVIVDRQESIRPSLPVSPISAQDLWINAILSRAPNHFYRTVESAVWVSSIIARVRSDTGKEA
jgi:predicted dehydrogenase